MLGRQSPGVLWRDLVRVVEKRQGEVAAERAARALRWGLTLRIVARQVLRPFVGRARAPGWRDATRTLQRECAAIR
jgi:hypothetical protein